MIAVVRVKGLIGKSKPVEDTLRRLHLYKKNFTVMLEDTPSARGMLAKVKDYITWGDVDAETTKLLQQRSNKPFARLSNPRKGFGRKGIKKSFTIGGVVGDRKEKINDLIKRMLT